MFLISLPVLIALGWWYVHKAARILEYINIRFSTVWGVYSYKLQEEQLKILKEIKNGLGHSHINISYDDPDSSMAQNDEVPKTN
jgi:hypothetical protein